MPGTFVIDTGATFAAVLLMSAGPKMAFGSETQQDTSKTGVPKWALEVAVTFQAENGMKPVSEVISVTITSPVDPAQGVTVPSLVTLDGLRAGITTPEKNDRGGIRGGKLWYTASGVAAPGGHSRRQSEAA